MPRIPKRRIPSPPTAAANRPRLSRDRIVAAALELMDQIGLDELTMRRLAANLDVQAAALYRHIRDKDELLFWMADALCAGAPVPDPSQPWQAQLAATAHVQRDLLRSRRDAARLIAGTMPTGPERLRLINATLGTLLGAGFNGDEAFQIALLLTNFVTGAVLEEESNPAAGAAAIGQTAEEIAAASTSWLETIPAGTYPHIHRAVSDISAAAPFDAGAHFGYGLRILLTGIEQRRDTQQPAP